MEMEGKGVMERRSDREEETNDPVPEPTGFLDDGLMRKNVPERENMERRERRGKCQTTRN